jgi:hypothetical protein
VVDTRPSEALCPSSPAGGPAEQMPSLKSPAQGRGQGSRDPSSQSSLLISQFSFRRAWPVPAGVHVSSELTASLFHLATGKLNIRYDYPQVVTLCVFLHTHLQ